MADGAPGTPAPFLVRAKELGVLLSKATDGNCATSRRQQTSLALHLGEWLGLRLQCTYYGQQGHIGPLHRRNRISQDACYAPTAIYHGSSV